MQTILWESRYLIEDNVTEWGAAVQKLRCHSEVRSRGRNQKTYKLDSLWWLLAKGGEGCDPMLCEDLHSREDLSMRAGTATHLYAKVSG